MRCSTRLRPYEVVPGETDSALAEVMEILETFLRERKHFEILERTPAPLRSYLGKANGRS